MTVDRSPEATARRARAEARHRDQVDQERRATRRLETDLRQAHWRSKESRRQVQPPHQVDALVAWFKREYDLAVPDKLHSDRIWFDTVSPSEAEQGIAPVGGSLVGSLAYSPAFRARLEGSPHAKDRDDELVSPFRSSCAWLRKGRPHIAQLLETIARHDFDWRAIVGRPFYARSRVDPTRRVLVMALPEDVMEAVLVAGLEALWRETFSRMPPLGE